MPDMADYGIHETEAFQPVPRISRTRISVEEYLRTSYSPDREYRDGIVLERNVGDKEHSRLQARLAQYLGRRRKQWNIEVYTELRVQITPGWYPLPDVCIYALPDFEERFPSRPPLLWIEILSQDDLMKDVWKKAGDLLQGGVPLVWIIDPTTLESELRTSDGILQVVDKTLRVPGSPIEISLVNVMEE
jgi:Uma2 family endonuclease